MEKDRRVQRRFRAKPGCHIAYVEGTGGVRDISLTGLFILDDEPLPVGDRVKFSLCSGAEQIALDGVVVRSEPNRGMAIQLMNTSREASRRLQLYFSSLPPDADRRVEQRVLVKIS